jgi:hypothetical protein
VITFKQFLNEELDEDITEPEEIANTILRDCKPFLRQSGIVNFKENGMYRGVRMHGAPRKYLDKYDYRTSRTTTDSSEQLVETLDNFFVKKCGMAFRKESFFGCGSQVLADNYGDLCMVFPLGEIEYAWSKTIPDAWEFFETPGDTYGFFKIVGQLELSPEERERAKSDAWVRSKDPRWYDLISEYLEKAQPYEISENLHEAIIKYPNSEIMMRAINGHYVLNLNMDGLSQSAQQTTRETYEKVFDFIRSGW